MTGIDRERLERRLRWAAEQLGLNPQATPKEVRAAWLRRLPEKEFVPPTEARWALELLLDPRAEGYWQARAEEAATAAEGEQLRAEVKTFAHRFWDLSIEERRRTWQELYDRCSFARPLQARLRLLEAGLTVDTQVTHANARVVELAEHVRELFVLRPGPRARTRQDLLRGMLDKRKEWKAASRRLRRANPKLAALGDDLLRRIKTALPKRKPIHTLPRWVYVCIVMAAVGFLGGFLKEAKRPTPPAPKEFKLDPSINEKAWKHLQQRLDEIKGKQGAKQGKGDGKSP